MISKFIFTIKSRKLMDFQDLLAVYVSDLLELPEYTNVINQPDFILNYVRTWLISDASAAQKWINSYDGNIWNRIKNFFHAFETVSRFGFIFLGNVDILLECDVPMKKVDPDWIKEYYSFIIARDKDLGKSVASFLIIQYLPPDERSSPGLQEVKSYSLAPPAVVENSLSQVIPHNSNVFVMPGLTPVPKVIWPKKV
jgi:hypothetical protein